MVSKKKKELFTNKETKAETKLLSSKDKLSFTDTTVKFLLKEAVD